MITPSGNSLNLTYCKDRRQALRAAAPFQSFVDAEDQRTISLVQVLEQQHEQDASRLAGRPHRPVEHLMIAA